MNRLFNAALRIQQFCDAEAWRSCIIGALAVQRWGEPRLTLDVDVSLLTGFGTEAAFVDRLLTAFTPRITQVMSGLDALAPARGTVPD
jgi:hypothetical protein